MITLSLFDGMSTGRISCKRAKIKIDKYLSSEVNKYALQIASKNYSVDDKDRLGDVKLINSNDLPQIDLLIGGSPCTNLSFCGKREGMITKENIEMAEKYGEIK